MDSNLIMIRMEKQMFIESIKFTKQQMICATSAYVRAEKAGDIKKMRRLNMLFMLHKKIRISIIEFSLQVSKQTLYQWLRQYIMSGLRGFKSGKSPGRPPKLTKTQRRALARCIDKGPSENGFIGNCWRTPMLQELINEKFGVFYNARYISELLGNMGFSYQKAKFTPAGADKDERQEWLDEKWPAILAEAISKNAMLLFGDECSFPQWGTLTYTWSRKGCQPEVLTSGNRKSYKVFGLIDYFKGRFFSSGHEGKLNAESYIAFLRKVMAKTKKFIVLIHDGAPYHKSAAVREFIKKNSHRISAHRLPTYSPDFNPIEKLWKKIKEKGTHLVYFPTFEDLVDRVHEMMNLFDNVREEVLALFGFYKKMES